MTLKLTKGLVEAYKSIYSDSTDVQEEIVVDEVEELFEINEENLFESIENYLVIGGFVDTLQEAKNIIPHLSEKWFNDIASTIIISEQIINHFIENGYDANEITEEHLYEFCMNESFDLSEASVNFGQLANLLTKAKGAATSPATRQAATGLLQTGQKVVQQTGGPIVSGVTRRVQSAAQTGQQAVQQASQAAAQGPKGPIGKTLAGVKKGLEVLTGAKPGSGSRIRRSLMVGGTGGLLGSTGAGQSALNAAGRFVQGGVSAVMGGQKPAQTQKPEQKKAGLDLTPQGTIRLR